LTEYAPKNSTATDNNETAGKILVLVSKLFSITFQVAQIKIKEINHVFEDKNLTSI
jgi:hypothetical protein